MRIADLMASPDEYIGKRVEVSGRVRTYRDMKGVGFIELWDGSCMGGLQVVLAEDKLHLAEGANTGAVLSAGGTIQESPAKGQRIEMQAEALEITGGCDGEYPLQKKRHSFEYLRTIPHLRPRTNTFFAVFKLRSVLSQAIHEFFAQHGFIYVHTPIITSSDAEGAGEMFRVTTLDMGNPPRTEGGEVDFNEDFFGKSTNLSVSGQLNVEAFALTYGNCYTFGPTFRSENSNTARHASEFWMMEPEMAYCDLEGNMQWSQEMLKFCIEKVLERCPEEMEFFDKFVEKGLLEKLDKVYKADFKHLTYTEAISLLEQADRKFEYPVKWGIDLQSEHERYISEEVINGPVFLTDYPADIKAFYMRMNEDGKTVRAMDLLVPGIGEIIGGSQREERYDVLLGRMEALGMDIEEYQWYLDLRRFGSIEHSGYGLGLDRAIMYMSGMQNIRDVQPYPRTPRNCLY